MSERTHTIPGNNDTWWQAGALKAIMSLAATGKPFTAADLEDLGVGQPDHSCRWGSVFAEAKALGLIRRVGYTASRRPSRSGGVCAVWQGAAA